MKIAKLLLILILVLVYLVPASVSANDVCPEGSAKWNADTGCEYGCTLANVTFAGPTVSWQDNGNGNVVSICVKYSTVVTRFYFSPATTSGSYTTPDDKDISHIVLWLETPNALELVEFSGTATQWGWWYLAIAGMLAVAMLVLKKYKRL